MNKLLILSCLFLVACSEPLTAKSIASGTSVCLEYGGIKNIEFYNRQYSPDIIQWYKAVCNNGMIIYNKETN